MNKKIVPVTTVLLVVLLLTVGLSGCTEQTATQQKQTDDAESIDHQNDEGNSSHYANRPPIIQTCNFQYINGIDSKTVRFHCQAVDYDGSIAVYHWSLSDGFSSRSPGFTHTFRNPGVYNATVVVIDNDGAEDSQTISVPIQRQ